MGKELLKENIKKRQNGHSAIEKIPLPKDSELWDTDRVLPKKDGGIYTLENTRGLDPKEHLKRHDNYRERNVELNNLKVIVDARKQLMKQFNACNNRLLAYKRTVDDLDESTIEFLKLQAKETSSQLSKLDSRIKEELKSMSDPLIKSAIGVKGLGPITIAFMLVYVDIEKTEYASSLWSYVGMTKPSWNRYTKGESSGGNKTLRTVLYSMAESMIKTRSVYRDVYDAEKLKLSNSKRIVKSCNTQGKWSEMQWMDTKPSHRHGAAIRKIIKHFLADWWVVARTLKGLPTPKLYVEEHLGHTDIIKPEERGWIYIY